MCFLGRFNRYMNMIAKTLSGQQEDHVSADVIMLEDVRHCYMSPPFTLSIPRLAVRSGEAISIVGRSGVGKTTLLSLILGLVEPERGHIAVRNELPSMARKTGAFGVGFQNASLLPWLTVFRNAVLPWRLRGEFPDYPRVEKLLSNVGLWDYRDAYPADLSGGMRSRLSLVRAIARTPPILVLDEPFSNLDEFTRMQMASLVSTLQADSQSTMIFVTHNATEALLMSDRVVLLGHTGNGAGHAGIIREFKTEFRNQHHDVTGTDKFRLQLAELAACFSHEREI
jgi:ABC-type nitrate/sulfonate/bicarbonate transport system ATPase subunit